MIKRKYPTGTRLTLLGLKSINSAKNILNEYYDLLEISKPIIFNNVTYKSQNDLYDTLGINASNVQYIRKKLRERGSDISIEDACKILVKNKVPITYDNKIYLNRIQLSNTYKIALDLVYHLMIEQKLDIENDSDFIKIFNMLVLEQGNNKTKTEHHQPTPVTYKGVSYPNKKQLCMHLGINYINVTLLKRKIQQNGSSVSFEDACKIAVSNKKPIIYGSNKYPSRTSLIKHFRAPIVPIYSIIIDNKLDIESDTDFIKAFEITANNNNIKLSVYFRGTEYASLSDLTRKLDINHMYVYKIMKQKNVDFLKACEIILDGREQRKYMYDKRHRGKKINYRGYTYNDLPTACKALEINYSTVWNNIRVKKLSMNDSIDSAILNKVAKIYTRFDSIVDLLNHFNITENELPELMQSLFKQDEQLGRAGGKYHIKYHGITFSSKNKLFSTLGISAASPAIYMKANPDITFDQAVDKVLKNKLNRMKIICAGVPYSYYAALTSLAGVAVSSFHPMNYYTANTTISFKNILVSLIEKYIAKTLVHIEDLDDVLKRYNITYKKDKEFINDLLQHDIKDMPKMIIDYLRPLIIIPDDKDT